MSEALRLEGVGHRYGGAPALAGVSFAVQRGELVAVLGPSGCGKTTLLRAIAGLITPTEGRIWIGGAEAAAGGRERVPIEQRRIGLVFQEYALFPHLTAAQNVGFGLPRRDPGREARIRELLAAVGLGGLAERRPAELSGGQQQRVALARALAPRPHLLLLDEPFANLDAGLRGGLGLELRRVLAAEGAAALLVTHDAADALGLADQVAALLPDPAGGYLAQLDTPEALYSRPASPALARLTGPCWFLDGEGRGPTAATAIGGVPLARPLSGPARLMVRPEDTGFTPGPGPCAVRAARFLGRGWRLVLDTPAGEALAEVAQAPAAPAGAVSVRAPAWGWPASASQS